MSTVMNSPAVRKLLQGIEHQDRRALAKAITLIESSLPSDKILAEELLSQLPAQENCLVVGFTGAPGVGKSSLLEVFGSYLLEQEGKSLAILAIDPSSPLSGGSILGDKTRMVDLSRQARCFIRPSPGGHMFGGLARRTFESILLCAAAGYDYVFIETIGNGQADHQVAQLVDLLVLLEMPGAGDHLQGMKRGVLEMADLILITKADHAHLAEAKIAQQYLEASLQERPDISNKDRILLTSAQEKTGFELLTKSLHSYFEVLKKTGELQVRRQGRIKNLIMLELLAEIKERLEEHPATLANIEIASKKILAHQATIRTSAKVLADQVLSS